MKNTKRKSSFDEINARIKCMACGEFSHWFRDNSKFSDAMKANLAARRNK